MRVLEKETDRKAYAHVRVDGQVKELEEYGEYIDPTDKAICCYVPVEEGDKLTLFGRFSGTALDIHHDALIDGVFRKAGQCKARTVQTHANRKLDVTTFLYRTKGGLLDTHIIVTRRTGANELSQSKIETTGTLELRVYVRRQLGQSYSLGKFETFDSIGLSSTIESTTRAACFRQVKPEFYLAFERDSAPLDKGKATREKTKIKADRPGLEPWAIFRFHYRSIGSIEEQNMPMTWDPYRSKPKGDPHSLSLEPVPPLTVGIKPSKDDGDNSTQASSVLPSDPISTSVKGNQNAVPTAILDFDNEDDSLFVSEKIGDEGGLPSTSQSVPAQPPAWTKLFSAQKETVVVARKDAASTTATESHKDRPTRTIPFNPINNPAEKSSGTGMAQPAHQVGAATQIVASQTPALPSKSSNSSAPPKKKASPKPPPISIPDIFSNSVIAIRGSPSAPAKRPAEFEPSTPQDPKRTKTIETPAYSPITATSNITPLSTILTPIATPRTRSIEYQVAEQRRKLEAVRARRQEMAKKQEDLNKKMEPYKKRMEEELQRLNIELAEEEASVAEDEDQYRTSLQMLVEFEGTGKES